MGRCLLPALRRLFVLLLAFEMGYLVLINGVLSLHLVERAFGSTDSIKLRIGKAYSWFPGRVHVERVLVSMQDHNLQWSLTLAAADVDIRFDELAKRTVHLTRVRGEGAVFRHRQRVVADALGEASTLALPPIDGQDDPPAQSAWVAGPPVGEFEYAYWTIQIDDVDTTVRELWSQQFRYEGAGRVRGAFRLRPAKHLWVGPALLELERGTLSAGDGVLLSDMSARIDCTVLPFHVDVPVGAGVLAFISARVRLSAQVASIAPLALLAPAGVTLEDGSGQLAMDVTMREGSLTRESSLRYETDRARLEARGVGASLSLALSLGGGGARKGEEGVAALSLRSGLVARSGDHHAPVRVEQASLELSTTSLDATMPWRLGRVSLRLGEIEASDLRALNDPAGGGVRVRDGRAHLTGFLELNGALEGSGALSAQASGHGASAEGLELGGALSAALEGESLRMREKSGRLSARIAAPSLAASRAGRFAIALDGVRVSGEGALHQGGAAADGALDAAVESLQATVGEARASARRASAALRAADVRIPEGAGRISALASLGDIDASGGSTGSLWIARAAALGISAEGAVARGQELSGTAEAKLDRAYLSSGSLDLRSSARAELRMSSVDVAEHTGRIEARARASRTGVSGGRGTGAWAGRLESAEVFALLDLPRGVIGGTGEVRAALRGARFQRAGTELSGEVALKARLAHVAVERPEAVVWGGAQANHLSGSWGGKSVDGWWGRVDLDGATVVGGDSLELRSALRASFRDGLPLLYALAGEQDIPAWLPDVLHLNGLRASGTVRQERGMLVVDVPEASGGPLQAAGRVVSGAPGGIRAALLAQVMPLSLGIQLRGAETSLSPMAGRGWLNQRLGELETAVSPGRPACGPRSGRAPGDACGARRP